MAKKKTKNKEQTKQVESQSTPASTRALQIIINHHFVNDRVVHDPFCHSNLLDLQDLYSAFAPAVRGMI